MRRWIDGRIRSLTQPMGWRLGWKWLFLLQALWFLALDYGASPSFPSMLFTTSAIWTIVAGEVAVIPLGLAWIRGSARRNLWPVAELFLGWYPRAFLLAAIITHIALTMADRVGAWILRSGRATPTPELGEWLFSGRAAGQFALVGAVLFLCLRWLLLSILASRTPERAPTAGTVPFDPKSAGWLLWAACLPFTTLFFYGKEALDERDTVPILGVMYVVCEAYAPAAASKLGRLRRDVPFTATAWLESWVLVTLVVYLVGTAAHVVANLAGLAGAWRLSPALFARFFAESYDFDWRVLFNILAFFAVRLGAAVLLLRRRSRESLKSGSTLTTPT